MEQPTITNFFHKRKRSKLSKGTVEHAKVLVLEHTNTSYGICSEYKSIAEQGELEGQKNLKGDYEANGSQPKVLFSSEQPSCTQLLLCKSKPKNGVSSHSGGANSTGARHNLNKDRPRARSTVKPKSQPDIRQTFLNVKPSVKFELKGTLSPKKMEMSSSTSSVKSTIPSKDSSLNEPKCALGEPALYPSSSDIPNPPKTRSPYKPGGNNAALCLDQNGAKIEADVGRDLPKIFEENADFTNLGLTPGMDDSKVEVKLAVDSQSNFKQCCHASRDCPSKCNSDESPESGPSNQPTCSSLSNPLGAYVSAAPVHLKVNSQKQCAKDETTMNARRDLGLMTPRRLNDTSTKKELSYSEIKSRLSRSAKLAEIRESLAKIDKGSAKLKDIEERKKQWQNLSPKLDQFKTIAVEVRSPVKNVPNSPQKISSPTASPSKAPAYLRLSPLASAGLPTLSLPFKYRCLAEVFRCVDTIVSLMYNRKECITFKKLKPAVQQMLRRNFMESHLGQIKHIFSGGFTFNQEKVRTFAYTSKADDYDLTITPVLDDNSQDSESSTMSPSCLLSRRKTFTENLINTVKNHHEEFLLSLDPPLKIPRDKLTRWHPEFDLNNVPEIEPALLPQPPNVAHYSSAKDVLTKAKTLFSCNVRMERALERVGQTSVTKETQEILPRQPESSPVSAALKGIPKAILERVRANQAARAIVAMSRTPEEDKLGEQYARLPELARIIRNIFVGEKKKVMLLEVAIQKIENSYREKLVPALLQEHVKLIMKSVPGWLEIQNVRKADYVKLSKNADMSKVTQKLEQLAKEKNNVP